MKMFKMFCTLLVLECTMGVAVSEAQSSRNWDDDDTTFFRIINFSPDSPAFDICRDGRVIARGSFYEDQTRYLPLEAGVDTALTRHFAGNGCSPDLLLNTTPLPGVVLEPDRYITGMPIASFFEGFPPSAVIGPPALVLEDMTEAPRGRSNVRFINVAINGADSVDFLVDGQVVAGGVEAIRENTVLIVPGAEQIPYFELDPGFHEFSVEDSASGEVLLTRHLRAGNRRAQTLYFHGSASGDPGLNVTFVRDGRRARRHRY